MTKIGVALLTLLTLSSCAGAPPPQKHGGGHGDGAAMQRDLTVADENPNSLTEIAFAVKEGDSVFTDYGISHTKEMHLIVVRDDLRYFSHLHPDRDAQGTWHVSYTPPTGGRYRLYADFVEGEGAAHTIQFVRAYAGDLGETGVVKDEAREKVVSDHRITFSAIQETDEVTFTYTIAELNGHPVTTLQDYLGAKGHSVLISAKGDFVHTHPSSEGSGPEVTFETAIPQEDFYRVFTQFQIEGEVITVPFDWEVE